MNQGQNVPRHTPLPAVAPGAGSESGNTPLNVGNQREGETKDMESRMPISFEKIEQLKNKWTNWLTDDPQKLVTGADLVGHQRAIPSNQADILSTSRTDQADDFAKRMELFMAKKKDEMDTKLKAYSVEQVIRSPIIQRESFSPKQRIEGPSDVKRPVQKSPVTNGGNASLRVDGDGEEIYDQTDRSNRNSFATTKLRVSALNTRVAAPAQPTVVAVTGPNNVAQRQIPERIQQQQQQQQQRKIDTMPDLGVADRVYPRRQSPDGFVSNQGAQRLVLSSGGSVVVSPFGEYNRGVKGDAVPDRDTSPILGGAVGGATQSGGTAGRSTGSKGLQDGAEKKGEGDDDMQTTDFLSRARREILDSASLESLYKRYAVLRGKEEANTNGGYEGDGEEGDEGDMIIGMYNKGLRERGVGVGETNGVDEPAMPVGSSRGDSRVSAGNTSRVEVGSQGHVSLQMEPRQTKSVHFAPDEEESDQGLCVPPIQAPSAAVGSALTSLVKQTTIGFAVLSRKLDTLTSLIETTHKDTSDGLRRVANNKCRTRDTNTDGFSLPLQALRDPVATVLGTEPLLGVPSIRHAVTESLSISLPCLRLAAELILTSPTPPHTRIIRPAHELLYSLLGKAASTHSQISKLSKPYPLGGSGGALSPEELTSTPVEQPELNTPGSPAATGCVGRERLEGDRKGDETGAAKGDVDTNDEGRTLSPEEWQTLAVITTGDTLNLFDADQVTEETQRGILKLHEMLLSSPSCPEVVYVVVALCFSLGCFGVDHAPDAAACVANAGCATLSTLPLAEMGKEGGNCTGPAHRNGQLSLVESVVRLASSYADQRQMCFPLHVGRAASRLAAMSQQSALLQKDGFTLTRRVSPAAVTLWGGIWQYVMSAPSIKLETVFKMALAIPRTGRYGLGAWAGGVQGLADRLCMPDEPFSLVSPSFDSQWAAKGTGAILPILSSVVGAGLTGLLLARTRAFTFRRAFASGAILIGVFEAGMAAVRRAARRRSVGGSVGVNRSDVGGRNNSTNDPRGDAGGCELGEDVMEDDENQENDRALTFYPGSDESIVLGCAYFIHVVCNVLLALNDTQPPNPTTANPDRVCDPAEGDECEEEDTVFTPDAADAIFKAAIQGILFGQEGDARLLFNIPAFIPDEVSAQQIGILLAGFFEYGLTPRYDNSRRNTALRSILTHPVIYGFLQTLIASNPNNQRGAGDNRARGGRVEDGKAFSRVDNSATFVNIASILGAGVERHGGSSSDSDFFAKLSEKMEGGNNITTINTSTNANTNNSTNTNTNAAPPFLISRQPTQTQARMVSAPFPFNLSFLSAFFDSMDLHTIFNATVTHFRMDFHQSHRKKAPPPRAFKILQAQMVEAEQKGLKELGAATALRDAFQQLLNDLERPLSLLAFDGTVYRRMLSEILKTDVRGFCCAYINGEEPEIEQAKLPVGVSYTSSIHSLCVCSDYGLDILICGLFNVSCLVHTSGLSHISTGSVGLNTMDVLEKIVGMMN